MKTKQIKLTVRKLDVYNEVAKTTAYAGAKQLDDDEHAYDRVFTTDEDRLMLERYFGEASREIVSNLPTSYIVEVCDYNTGTGIDLNADYKLTLEIPEAFPDALAASVEATMSFFFTTYIVSQWLALQKDETASVYAEKAQIFLGNISTLLHRRSRPVRLKTRPF
jgi:hypothetical protein